MKKILLFSILILNQIVFSQTKEYSGVVSDKDGLPLPGVNIIVKGTDRVTQSDFDGKFNIKMPDSLHILTFNYFGFESLDYKLNENKRLEISLKSKNQEDIMVPQTRGIWISIGSFSDIGFAPYGISISNGQEEQNLLHFEDFQEYVSFKLAFATNFNDNSTFETRFTYHYPLINGYLFNSSLEFIDKNYSSLDFKDYNFSTKIRYLKTINSLITVKIGVQQFDNQSGFGGAVGLERKHYLTKIHYGGQIGYWNDYITYNLYLQSFFYKRKLSFIAKYDRINETDFFKVGIHYLFKTKENRY